jgi:NAD(P)-dependent dehydrogenase (short-subunit alcohol dehydrogenase family)
MQKLAGKVAVITGGSSDGRAGDLGDNQAKGLANQSLNAGHRAAKCRAQSS